MTGKDPFETGSGGSFRAFMFSSGVETLDIEAFRDDTVDVYLDDAMLNLALMASAGVTNQETFCDLIKLGIIL